MRIGLIGLGSIGKRHYDNLHHLGLKAVVFSARKDVAGVAIVSDWKKFAEAGPFEAIFIANETGKHLTTIRKCLALQPKGLFIEKPISATSRGLERLAKELKEMKISAWVGYNLHFFAPLLRVKEILNSRELGKIYSV